MSKKLKKELVDRVEATIKIGDEELEFVLTPPNQEKEKSIIKKMKDAFSSSIERKDIELQAKRLGLKEKILTEQIENSKGSEKLDLMEKLDNVFDEMSNLNEKDKNNFYKEISLDELYEEQVYNRIEPNAVEVAQKFIKIRGAKELVKILNSFWSEATGNN